MPRNANIAIIEDDERYINILVEELTISGHKIVSLSQDLETALKAVDDFTSLGVQVALVDGNLSYIANYGEDGVTVVNRIHEVANHVKTISIASMGQVPGTEYNARKSGSEFLHIGDFIDKL